MSSRLRDVIKFKMDNLRDAEFQYERSILKINPHSGGVDYYFETPSNRIPEEIEVDVSHMDEDFQEGLSEMPMNTIYHDGSEGWIFRINEKVFVYIKNAIPKPLPNHFIASNGIDYEFDPSGFVKNAKKLNDVEDMFGFSVSPDVIINGNRRMYITTTNGWRDRNEGKKLLEMFNDFPLGTYLAFTEPLNLASDVWYYPVGRPDRGESRLPVFNFEPVDQVLTTDLRDKVIEPSFPITTEFLEVILKVLDRTMTPRRGYGSNLVVNPDRMEYLRLQNSNVNVSFSQEASPLTHNQAYTPMPERDQMTITPKRWSVQQNQDLLEELTKWLQEYGQVLVNAQAILMEDVAAFMINHQLRGFDDLDVCVKAHNKANAGDHHPIIEEFKRHDWQLKPRGIIENDRGIFDPSLARITYLQHAAWSFEVCIKEVWISPQQFAVRMNNTAEMATWNPAIDSTIGKSIGFRGTRQQVIEDIQERSAIFCERPWNIEMVDDFNGRPQRLILKPDARERLRGLIQRGFRIVPSDQSLLSERELSEMIAEHTPPQREQFLDEPICICPVKYAEIMRRFPSRVSSEQKWFFDLFYVYGHMLGIYIYYYNKNTNLLEAFKGDPIPILSDYEDESYVFSGEANDGSTQS